MAHRVFVYGTLIPGQKNVAVAERAGMVSATSAIVHGYRLYQLEPEGYPALVCGPGVVHGSVLELTGSLDELDELEGVHLRPPLYDRVRCAPDGLDEAWVYRYARPERLSAPGATWIPDGRWVPNDAYES